MNPDLEAPAGTPIVTLACGEAVFNTDPRWLAECQARHRHVLTLRGMALQARREYLKRVTESEGELSALRLKEAFAKEYGIKLR